MMSDPFMPLFSLKSGVGFKAADGVYGLTVQIANVYFIENPQLRGKSFWLTRECRNQRR